MGTVVCVTSGKGGVGKSSVTVGMARAFAARGRKTILLELDIGLRGLDLLFGISSTDAIRHDVLDVALGRCSIAEAVIPIDLPQDEAAGKSSASLHYLAAPTTLPDHFDFSQVVDLVTTVREQYDIILIDTSAGLGLSLMLALKTADLTVLVTTPDLVCARAGATITCMLEQYECYDYRVVINKVRAKLLRNTPIGDLDEVMDLVGAPLLGVIPEDDVYRKRLAQGKPMPESSRIARIYDAISRRIEGEAAPLIVSRLL